MNKILILLMVLSLHYSGLRCGSIRRFSHVKSFYKDIAETTIELAVKYNTPPAVIFAMAGLESGYGEGYIAQITGNILSLGANKGETRLPPLNLPILLETGNILFDKKVISKYHDDELEWKMRPGSLKKDYRPQTCRGTENNLAYFKYHPKKRKAARKQNIEDFMSKWLNVRYKFPVFAETRHYLDSMVKEYGKEVLFSPELNMSFIKRIGGKPGSFNYRKEWLEKVIWIMENAELVQLTRSMYYDKLSFEEAWLIHN